MGQKIEYDIEKYSTIVATKDFTNTRRSSVILPIDGDVVYAVAHQHCDGIGSALYGEDGRVICSSNPIYRQGMSAGDEAGYIVGRSTCYPKLGSARILKGEALTMESNYSNEKSHTGVMGHFYILVADSSVGLNEAIHKEEDNKYVACWLSFTSTLLFLLQKTSSFVNITIWKSDTELSQIPIIYQP